MGTKNCSPGPDFSVQCNLIPLSASHHAVPTITCTQATTSQGLYYCAAFAGAEDNFKKWQIFFLEHSYSLWIGRVIKQN